MMSDPILAATPCQVNYDDLAPTSFQFRIKGVEYVLLEPSEAAHVAVRSRQLQGARFTDGKLSAPMDGVAETQSLLVSLCLANAEGKPIGNPTALNLVKGWPSRVVRDLHDRARKMGGMDEEETQQSREEGFRHAASRLVSLATSPEEKELWRAWMVDRVNESVPATPAAGSPDEQAKN